ncbi:hypothetical protein ACOMHN_018671 [Nucella lapillus]
MSDQRLFGDLQQNKQSQDGQEKRFKDTLKVISEGLISPAKPINAVCEAGVRFVIITVAASFPQHYCKQVPVGGVVMVMVMVMVDPDI